MKEYLPKILIVDDSPENLKILGNSLKKLNYNVLTALSGKQALALADNKLPDLIILDVMMPVMDGFEVCRILKENKQHRHIPVIFLTALSEPENVNRGLEIGASDYITKPYQVEDLIIKIRHHLRSKQKNDYLEKIVRIEQIILKFFQYEIELRAKNAESRRTIDSSILNEEDPNNSNTLYQLLRFISNYNFALFEHNFLQFHIQEIIDDIKIIGNTTNHNIKKNSLASIVNTNQYNGNFYQIVKLFEKFINLDHPYKNLVYLDFQTSLTEISGYSDLFSSKLTFNGTHPAFEKYQTRAKTQLFEQRFKEYDVELITLFTIDLIVHLLNGSFTVETLDDKTVLSLDLIFNRYQTGKPDGEVLEEEQFLLNIKVLVVEDNELNQAYISSLLTDFKIDFEIVTNGADAIDRALSGDFKVILMDVNLPKISGLEVVQTLRKKFNYQKPIVAVSGHSDHTFIKQCLSSGFNHYLVKPHDAEELKRVILKAAGEESLNTKIRKNIPDVNVNVQGQRFNYDKAKELANGNNEMLKYWLNNLCELLNKALPVLSSIRDKKIYTKGNKVFHDLINYSSYFELSSICMLINELNRLEPEDSEYLYELEYTIQLLETEIKSVITYYSEVNQAIEI